MKKKLPLFILTIAFITGALGISKINAQNLNYENTSIEPLIEDNSGCLSKSSSGKAGKTGSPGETTCTSCHNQNTGSGSVSITSSNLTGWSYTPGQTYTIDVNIAQSGIPLFAFGFEALLASGANAGTLIITNTTETQIKTATISGNSRNNVVQKSNGGLSNNSHIFTFNWTAPVAGTGNITFYVAGLACDNDGGTSGDFTYTSSQVVSEAVATPAPVASFNASSSNVCENENINFVDQSTNSPTSWAWDFGDGQSSTSQSPQHAYTTAGNYTVTLTATNGGGSNSTTTNITVNPTLVPSVSITPSAVTVCPGTTVILTANPTNGGTPVYSWTVDGNTVGSGNTYSAVFTDGQAVVCTMTSNAQCASPTAVNANFTTGVYTVASVTVSETSGTLNSTASTGNQWYEQTSGIINGENGQSYSPTTDGNYYSIVTDANGCTSTSNTVNYIYASISQVNENSFRIYPNPAKDYIVIENTELNSNISIENIIGKKVFETTGNMKENRIDISKFNSGIYFVNINNSKVKVVIEK